MQTEKKSLYSNLFILLVRGGVVFLFLFITYSFYDRAIGFALGDRSIILSFIAIWLFTAYFFLPRMHRFLARLYLPNYYIGRTHSKDGLLADPVNIALNGSKDTLVRAMEHAGWKPADPVNLRTSARIIKASLFKQSYPHAPISSLILFGRSQDLAFQKEVRGNPRARHHVRFWKTPPEWFLPGGYKSDWLGAATFDKSVGFSLFTGQITHKIEAETDHERNHLIETLKSTDAIEKIRIVEHFTTAYHHRNSGGDSIRTDGSMPFITLRNQADST